MQGEAQHYDAVVVGSGQSGGPLSTALIEADVIVINTGSQPAKPPIAGLDSVPTLDSTSVMDVDELPEHLIVIGGGYVGLEFGQMFRRFGSRVTIIEPGKHVLSRE